jgi:hypothetical protein
MIASTSSRITTNHDAIRRWAEERDAKPVEVDRGGDDDPGTVRLEFPGSRDNSLRAIGWDEWFQKFDKSKLALLYQEQAADGERSSFCKIVRREKADEVENALGGRGRSAARRGSPRVKKSARARAAAASEGETPEEPGNVSRSPVPEEAAGKRAVRKPKTRRQEDQPATAAQPDATTTPHGDGKDNSDGTRASCRSNDDAQR